MFETLLDHPQGTRIPWGLLTAQRYIHRSANTSAGGCSVDQLSILKHAVTEGLMKVDLPGVKPALSYRQRGDSLCSVSLVAADACVGPGAWEVLMRVR